MKLLYTALPLLLLLLLLLASDHFQATMAGSAFCNGKCKVRCSKASEQERCLKYCGLCCEECRCVPPGPTATRTGAHATATSSRATAAGGAPSAPRSVSRVPTYVIHV
uniref:Uncharacterized protein n=1 Tax=Ananas comosus var. bracteatus TaxID=296719 RepID=A0A6V7QDP6_ANACO|nr:unnamed protein product [Ananas comosus var. bracteatus]